VWIFAQKVLNVNIHEEIRQIFLKNQKGICPPPTKSKFVQQFFRNGWDGRALSMPALKNQSKKFKRSFCFW
jgi:hypothetical protein